MPEMTELEQALALWDMGVRPEWIDGQVRLSHDGDNWGKDIRNARGRWCFIQTYDYHEALCLLEHEERKEKP